MSDVVAWVSAGIAAVSAGVAVWQAIAANQSRAAASKSAADAAAAATRSSDALSTLSRLAEEEATRVDPPWVVQHVRGDTYRVLNNGRDLCRGVALEPVGDPHRFNGHEPEDIHPGAGKAFTFMAYGGMPPADRKVAVSWHLDRHTERMDWTGDIPPRPRKP